MKPPVKALMILAALPLVFVQLAPCVLASAWVYTVGTLAAAKREGFFYLAVAVLAANIVLSVTDEFGLFDLIVLLIDLVLLALLIATKTRYLAARHS